jgi:hypothetical protein
MLGNARSQRFDCQRCFFDGGRDIGLATPSTVGILRAKNPFQSCGELGPREFRVVAYCAKKCEQHTAGAVGSIGFVRCELVAEPKRGPRSIGFLSL